MRRWTAFRRIWLPQAVHRALPTLAGETVLQLKATPLVATITVIDLYAAASRVQRETYVTYAPLLLLALVYLAITGSRSPASSCSRSAGLRTDCPTGWVDGAAERAAAFRARRGLDAFPFSVRRTRTGADSAPEPFRP